MAATSAAEKSGQCLCGAIKFKATPKDNEVAVCHCSMCRRISAGPFFGADCGDSVEFENEDSLGLYGSSEWAERGFCKKCGSVLFWRLKDGTHNHVSLNAFDEPGETMFSTEVFIDEKPEYYSFAQKTQQLTGQEVFALFMGGEEQ
ncbi:MAG: GFA family protein [Pseudomonadota bacterium]